MARKKSKHSRPGTSKSHNWATSQGPLVEPHGSERKSCKVCGRQHSKNSHRIHFDGYSARNQGEPFCYTHETDTGSKTDKLAQKSCSTKHPHIKKRFQTGRRKYDTNRYPRK